MNCIVLLFLFHISFSYGEIVELPVSVDDDEEESLVDEDVDVESADDVEVSVLEVTEPWSLGVVVWSMGAVV